MVTAVTNVTTAVSYEDVLYGEVGDAAEEEK